MEGTNLKFPLHFLKSAHRLSIDCELASGGLAVFDEQDAITTPVVLLSNSFDLSNFSSFLRC